MTPTPATDAGHAAETMSNVELLTAYYRIGIQVALTDDMTEKGEVNSRAADLHAELLKRLNAAPARTAGTETGGTK